MKRIVINTVKLSKPLISQEEIDKIAEVLREKTEVKSNTAEDVVKALTEGLEIFLNSKRDFDREHFPLGIVEDLSEKLQENLFRDFPQLGYYAQVVVVDYDD